MAGDNFVSERVRKARRAANMSQLELAEKTGISVNSIRLCEGGKVQPRIDTITKISAALDVTVDYLYGRTNDPHTRLATQEDIERYFGGASSTTEDGVAITSRPDAALTHYFNLLNDEGQAVAVDRVKELSEIPRYKK